MFDQSKPRNGLDTIVPELAESWAWDDVAHQAHVQAAPGRQMARRQAVHRQGRAVHLAQADRQGRRRASAATRARIWWNNLQGGDDQRRFRGDLRARQAAAVVPRRCSPRTCRRSIPAMCRRREHAHQADRHRPVQVRHVRAEHGDQAGEESRLLEARPAVSRRHRVPHHRQPLDAPAGVRGQRVRPDLRRRHHRAAGGRHHGALAQGDLPAGADRRQHQPARESREAAVRQRACCARR